VMTSTATQVMRLESIENLGLRSKQTACRWDICAEKCMILPRTAPAIASSAVQQRNRVSTCTMVVSKFAISGGLQ